MKSKVTVKQKSAPAAQKRLIKLKSITVDEHEPGQCRVRVQIMCKRRTITCDRSGPAERDYKLMLAALCTLDALQKATDERMKMDLLFIERQQLDKINREVIMVLIDVNVDDNTRAA